MVRFKIVPKVIESADGEVEWKQEDDTPPPSPPPAPEPIPEAELKRERRKKKLREAQLAALEKGRKRVAENKRQRELKKKKEEAEFVKQGIEQTKTAKQKKTDLKKSTKESKIRETLLAKKKRKEWETHRKESWALMRESTLDKCETVEDFDELSQHLDTIEDEEIFDDEKLKIKLNKIYDLYKYVPKETGFAEE